MPGGSDRPLLGVALQEAGQVVALHAGDRASGPRGRSRRSLSIALTGRGEPADTAGAGGAVRPALAAPRAGDRGLECGEGIEPAVEARDAQDLGHRRRRRGQVQEPAEQPGTAPGAHQYGEAAGVGVAHAGQVDDEPAGAGAEQAEELLAQGWSAEVVELAGGRGDDTVALRPGGKL